MSNMIDRAADAAHQHSVAVEVVKMSPPAGVAGMSWVGFPLADWLIVLTIVYTALNIFFLLRDKWWRQRSKK